jgi:predicted HicB family RNase H-like nuclease
MSQQTERTNGVSFGTQALEVQRVARALFHQGPDWVTFFREMLGVNGVVRTIFPDQELLAAFETTEEYIEIQQMVAQLRARVKTLRPEEPERVITVRLPQSLHESLVDEAAVRRTSVNKLCISKLLQVVDDELVPNAKPTNRPAANPSRSHADKYD